MVSYRPIIVQTHLFVWRELDGACKCVWEIRRKDKVVKLLGIAFTRLDHVFGAAKFTVRPVIHPILFGWLLEHHQVEC